jgi:glycerol-3-phosphate acyltransferase PlsX
MGRVVAQVYLGVADPKVGLLNIGEEKSKGRELEKEAFALMSLLPLTFVGNVEGRDLGSGTADVVVTDGFTGNVLLKTVEGTSRAVGRYVLESLAAAQEPALRKASQVVLPHLLELRRKFDPEAYGGAHLVGTRGTVVIAHGSSSRVAIANALALASEGAERGLVDRIEAGLGA